MKTGKLYSIIYNDGEIVAADKSAGLTVTGERWAPEAPRLDKLLEETLGRKVFTVHRIDKDTSGIVLFALNAEAHRMLSLSFQERLVKKTYRAIVLCGGLQTSSRFIVSDKLVPGGGADGRTIIDNKNGKSAVTEFEVLEKFNGFALLQAEPLTGRTHQIRVHAAANNTPILCDKLYGEGKPLFLSQIKRNWRGDRFEEKPLISRQALHAYSLTFKHPSSLKEITFTAEYRKDMRTVLAQLRKARH